MRRTLLLLAAVLAAAFGTSLVYLYVDGVDTRALDGQHPRPVLVTKTLVQAGSPVDATAVTTRELPAVAVAEHAIPDLKSVSGKVLKYTVVAGEQLTTDMFGPHAASAVAADKVAVSVRIASIDRVAPLLKAGDLVNVYRVEGETALVEHPILAKARVFAVGGTGADPNSVTFVLSQPDALQLATAEAAGNRLILMIVGE